MRVMKVEVRRNDAEVPGFLGIEIAPSRRVGPNGIYVGLNAHFQLTQGEQRGNAAAAAKIIVQQWEAARSLESRLLSAIMESL